MLLEGFALGTPGLVNARSAVLEEHCRRSNAGLFYADGDEYAEALDLLVRDRRPARRRSARTAAATWTRSTAGTWCSTAGGR